MRMARSGSPLIDALILPTVQGVLAETGLAMGKLAQPVRVALTGRTASPGLFDVMLLLGRDKTFRRLADAIDMIKARQG